MEAVAPTPGTGADGRAASRAQHPPLVVAVDVVTPVALVAVVEAVRNSSRYRLVVGEDGVLEWLQVLGFATAAWALFSAARRAAGAARLALISCGIVVLGVIGEELAWGTRFLGSGVDFIEARNEQGETTLHNLGSGLETSFLGITVVALALAVPVVLRRFPFESVPLTVAWWLVVPAAYAAYRLAAGDVPYHVAKLSEAAEAVFALAVARLALSARRERWPRGAPAPAS